VRGVDAAGRFDWSGRGSRRMRVCCADEEKRFGCWTSEETGFVVEVRSGREDVESLLRRSGEKRRGIMPLTP
jgi:hypothetical protein